MVRIHRQEARTANIRPAASARRARETEGTSSNKTTSAASPPRVPESIETTVAAVATEATRLANSRASGQRASRRIGTVVPIGIRTASTSRRSGDGLNVPPPVPAAR
ncbi:MAG: hypothetical protein ACYSVY_16765 [Planctomycetota bacterium]